MQKYRYPFRPYPTGWYLALESAALRPGDVVPLELLGQDLVAFRSESGVATIVDAHCPHMGAHVGYGGVVEGEGIRCPFHAWRFGLDGRCDDVPYGDDRRPPRVGLGCHHVCEDNGLIMLFHSDSGAAPSWFPPTIPQWGQPGWVGYETFSWKIRMHVQELVENVPDMAHFAVVHGVPGTPAADYEVDGHVYRQRSYVRETDTTFTTQEVHGLGLVWLHTGSDIVFLTATTPLDDEYCDMSLLFLVNDPDAADGKLSEGPHAMVAAIAENTARDVPIWEHKVYRERAPLVPGDGPISAIRKWARQFYEESPADASAAAS
jgi:phenylpropionate dioxygenase-like ring-hydroxylating dioxygenase large terminal subunit